MLSCVSIHMLGECWTYQSVKKMGMYQILFFLIVFHWRKRSKRRKNIQIQETYKRTSEQANNHTHTKNIVYTRTQVKPNWNGTKKINVQSKLQTNKHTKVSSIYILSIKNVYKNERKTTRTNRKPFFLPIRLPMNISISLLSPP